MVFDGVNVENMVIVYEFVWVIGIGLILIVGDVEEMYVVMWVMFEKCFDVVGVFMWFLYGGFVKLGNVVELMVVVNVNGVLVGGVSLKVDDFFGIVSVYN